MEIGKAKIGVAPNLESRKSQAKPPASSSCRLDILSGWLTRQVVCLVGTHGFGKLAFYYIYCLFSIT